MKVPLGAPESFTSPTFAPPRKMDRPVPSAGTCPTGKSITTNFNCRFTDLTCPTGELAGAITRLVWLPAGFTLKTGLAGFAAGSLDLQPTFSKDATATATTV